MLKKFFTLMLVSGVTLMGSNSIELNLNDDTIRTGFEFDLNNIYDLNNNSGYYLTGSYLKSEDDQKNKSNNDEDKNIANIGVKLIGSYPNTIGLNFGLGMKYAYSKDYDKTLSATPLSLFLNYEFNDLISIETEIAYASKILSFDESTGYREAEAKLKFRFIDQAFAYVGSRKITTKFTNGVDYSYNDTIFFGFKVLF